MYINRVEIAGFVAQKPQSRLLPSGTPVANARLGQTHRFQDGNKQPQEHTNWHNLSFYGDLAHLAVTFEKGDHLYVEGAIEQRQFTPKDGSTRTVTEIVVRHCHLIAPPRHASSAAVTADRGEQLDVPENTSWPVR